MHEVDAREHLKTLIGRQIETYSGRTNRVLAIDGENAVVATQRSPKGASVPISWVKDAIDRLLADGEVEVTVKSLGYRSAFVAAVLLTLPNTRRAANPARVVLTNTEA